VGGLLGERRIGAQVVQRVEQGEVAAPREGVLGPVAARLQQAALADQQAGEADARKALTSAAYLQLRDDLDALVAEPPLTEAAARPADEVLRAIVAHTGKRLRHAVAAARDSDHDEALHEVRKAAKRVRYTAESAVPVLGEPVRRLVGVLKGVQEVLGDRQDTFVTRPLCTRLGLRAFAAGENAWTWGRLHALEQARCERAEQEFWLRWPQLRPVLRAATA